jgi:tetratricopeptide (TPR) repeat protein
MASVFLSYDHEDAALAAPIASALEKAGHSIWWDRQIHGGAEYNTAIEGAVERADVVVVLWSERSVKSAWVRDEAAEGRDRGKLVPIAVDGAKPPMGFRQYQTISLSSRRGTGRRDLAPLLHAIEALAGNERRPPTVAEQRTTRSFRLGWGVAAAAVIALIAIALLLWRPWESVGSAIVAVSAADSSPVSEDYARSLLVQLGELQSAKPEALKLVSTKERRSAGLVFEVAGASDANNARANLVLLNGRTGDLIWSKAFERPPQDTGDLREQLGYTAAQVLGCAVEAHPGGRAVLNPDTLKSYLNGCAGLTDASFEDLTELVPLFRSITVRAPQFEGAWSKLLFAEEQVYARGSDYSQPNAAVVRDLKRDIAAARRISPNIPEAYMAEADLLPLNAFGAKLALVDRAVASRPDNSESLGYRAGALVAVGRVNDALNDAQRAAEIDPISPRSRQEYIIALAQAGRTQAALDQLAKAERIWPGSSDIGDTRFSFHLRFGDPRIAWQMIEAGQTNPDWIRAKSFVEARLTNNPEDIERAIKDARAEYVRDRLALHHLVQTMSILGRDDELLDLLMTVPIEDATYVTDVTFRPAAREFWRNPNSLQYAKRVGLLQYWQTSGKWPDFCLEGDLPYDCQKEAAKYG